MYYHDLVRDFADRTRKNLEFIRRAAPTQTTSGNDCQVYEVTQLINSMLGLLVFPEQHFFEEIPLTPMDQLVANGWPEIRPTGNFPQAQNLQELFRYLRNAIAHFNIAFLAPDGEIEGVKLWNRVGGKKNWEVELSLETLEQLAEKFAASLDDWSGKPGKMRAEQP